MYVHFQQYSLVDGGAPCGSIISSHIGSSFSQESAFAARLTSHKVITSNSSTLPHIYIDQISDVITAFLAAQAHIIIQSWRPGSPTKVMKKYSEHSYLQLS
tara:strand:- start:233 stop:535 length:303 start_codon:yes stop_codon:yes gene_type:complete